MSSRPCSTPQKLRMVSIFWLIILACSQSLEPPVEAQTRPAKQQALPDPVASAKPHTLSPPLGLDDSAKNTMRRLEQLLRTHGTDPNNPWAIGHTLLALGPTLRLSNDQDAIDWLFSNYAERFVLDDSWLLRFPPYREATPIEPHPDLLLRVFTDIGLSPDRIVHVQGQPHVIGDLFKGSLAQRSAYTPKALNDLPWSLAAFASWSTPTLTWRDAQAQQRDLDALTDQASDGLNRATLFLAQAKAAGKTFSKQKQGIFAFSCGGSHLIQGVIHAQLRGFGSPKNKGEPQAQLALLAFRFPIEMAQIDAGMATHPQFQVPLLIQRLKLAGHTLETFARVAASGRPGAPKAEALTPYLQAVIHTVALLKTAGVFQNLERLKQDNNQLFLDTIGDSAHALRGMKIAVGAQPVFY